VFRRHIFLEEKTEKKGGVCRRGEKTGRGRRGGGKGKPNQTKKKKNKKNHKQRPDNGGWGGQFLFFLEYGQKQNRS